MNAPGDAGAAVSSGAVDVPATAGIPPALAARFPLRQEVSNLVLGGGVRGFGMLAHYAAPGPREIWLRRVTSVPGKEPYAPPCAVSVFDPAGKLVAVHDFTWQATAEAAIVLEVPAGPAGVWRVSFSGGRQFDRFALALPASVAWGVRGEMALHIGVDTPSPAWLYLPRTVKRVLVEQLGGDAAQLVLRDADGKELGRPGRTAATGPRWLCVLDPAPADTTIQIDLTDARGRGILVDGAPGLLCPSRVAAEQLCGGTVAADGFVCAGPLQARARRWLSAQRPETLNVSLTNPILPEHLERPLQEAAFFGKFAGLTGIAAFVRDQVTDPASPWCGSTYQPKPEEAPKPSWDTFLYSLVSPFDAAGVAGLVATPGQANPVYGNRALARRAAMVALYHFSALSGESLIREGNLFTGTSQYPMTHAFFVHGALAEGLALCSDFLADEPREIWRQGLLAISTKLADYQGYQSNQWTHNMRGVFSTYQATGAPRFRQWFEVQLNAYLDGAFGPDHKFGQHPAGFYLEEYGADGNYDNMNLASVVLFYQEYRELPDADPALVAKLRRSIERNLRFTSFFWLTSPAEPNLLPNAFNSRTPSNFMYSNPSGVYFAHREFDLALARTRLSPMPERGSGAAGTFPYYAVTDAWAERLVRDSLAKPLADSTGRQWFGGNPAPLAHAYRLPLTARPVKLPFEAPGLWELPGLVAWNRAGLYGVVFHDVVGTGPQRKLRGWMEGGPTLLWAPGTGLALGSLNNSRKDASVEQPEDVTHSCVFGETLAGKLFVSGKARSRLTWVEPQRLFEITSPVSAAAGSVTWRYELGEDELKITVRLQASQARTAFLNLPLIQAGNVNVTRCGDRVLVSAGNAQVVFACPAASGVWVTEPLPVLQPQVSVRGLRIPLAVDGAPVTIAVRACAATAPATLPDSGMRRE